MTEQPASHAPRPDAPIVDVDSPSGAVGSPSSRLREWIEEGRLPVHQVPPPRETPRENESEPRLWALLSDVQAIEAGEPLHPTPVIHDDLRRVYVIELEGCELSAHEGGSCIYVGQSWYPPRARFIQHLVGYNAGRRHVTRWGVRLRPDLYQRVRPTESLPAIHERERELAQQLNGDGLMVHGVDLG